MPFSDFNISYQNETTTRTHVRARFYEGEWVEEVDDQGDLRWRFSRTLLESRTVDFPPETDQTAIDARLLEILGDLSPHPMVGDAPD